MFAVQYVQSLYRQSQIRRENKVIAAQSGRSLLSLPEDILLMILDILEDGDQDSWTVWHSIEHQKGDVIRLSMTCWQLRTLSVPRLFYTINLRRHCTTGTAGFVQVDRPFFIPLPFSYPAVTTSKLRLIFDQNMLPASVAAHIRVLQVPHWSGSADKFAVSAAHHLVECIRKLPRLDTLSIVASEPTGISLKTAFVNSSISLPNIVELAVCPSTDWLMTICPNLRVLDITNCNLDGRSSTKHEFSVISDAGRLVHLQKLLTHSSWNEELYEHIVRCIPHLKVLSISGQRTPNFTLSNILKILTPLHKLERLDFVQPKLMQEPTIPWELAPSLNPATPSRLLESDRGITSAQEAVTRLVFETLPGLNTLTLGRRFIAKRQASKAAVVLRWEFDPHAQPSTMIQELVLNKSITTKVAEVQVADDWEEISHRDAGT